MRHFGASLLSVIYCLMKDGVHFYFPVLFQVPDFYSKAAKKS